MPVSYFVKFPSTSGCLNFAHIKFRVCIFGKNILRVLIVSSVHHIRGHTMLISLTLGDINFNCLATVVSATIKELFSPLKN